MLIIIFRTTRVINVIRSIIMAIVPEINYSLIKCVFYCFIYGLVCEGSCFSVFPTQNLLSDAEVAEDVVEGFLGGDLTAGDFGEDVEDVAEIFGEEVTADAAVKAFDDTM